MPQTDGSVAKRALRTAQRQGTTLLSVLMVAGGLLLLAYGNSQDPFISAIGTTLVATGTLSIGWQILVRREQDAALRQDIHDAVTSRWSDPAEGVIRLGRATFSPTDLEQALNRCQTMHATCLYDKHWLESEWSRHMEAYLLRKNKRVEFIVPYPSDSELMNRLADRHNLKDQVPPAGGTSTAGQQMEHRVRDLIAHLKDLPRAASSEMTILYVKDYGPSYTSYLFAREDGAGMGMTRQYGHRMGTAEGMPETLFAQSGGLWNYAMRDYEKLKKRAISE